MLVFACLNFFWGVGAVQLLFLFLSPHLKSCITNLTEKSLWDDNVLDIFVLYFISKN